jgi:hypothetical protein
VSQASEVYRKKIREMLSEKKEEKQALQKAKKIKSEEEYFSVLERLVKGAEYLSGDLTEEKRKKAEKLYEELERDILEYNKND